MTAEEPPPSDATSNRQESQGGLDTDAARDFLLDEHAVLLREVLDCADRVAAGWDDDSTTARPVDAFASELRKAGVLNRLPAALAGAVDAAGGDLQANPVPAPPYVVVTAEGLLLRATLPAGRLVVTVAAFALERDPRRYVHAGKTPADALTVERRE